MRRSLAAQRQIAACEVIGVPFRRASVPPSLLRRGWSNPWSGRIFHAAGW